MARTITWDELRGLAAFEAKAGRAISLYLDLDPSVSPTPTEAHTRLNSLLDQAAKSAAATSERLTHTEREALRSDFDRVRRYSDREFIRDGARGLAVFCDTPDGLWAVMPLIDSVRDEIRIDTRLYLAPLAPLVGRGDGALVVVASREQG